MNNNTTLLQIFANNNIGELYPVDGPDCFPKFGHICGYDHVDLIVGFDSNVGWGNKAVDERDVILKEYKSYRYAKYKE